MIKVVTDEGIDNFELEYPVADIKAEEFGKLWSLNNKSYGGDDFVVEKDQHHLYAYGDNH